MELEGCVWKEKSHWLIEVLSLNIMTQGYTRKEALEMIRDAIKEILASYFSPERSIAVEITINLYSKGVIGVSASDERLLFSLALRRLREESGTTVREASKRLGSDSPNAYAQYERGKFNITLEKFDELLRAANPQRKSLLSVV